LVLWRSAYRAWLVDARANGRYLRRTILIGADPEIQRLVDVLTVHRELGMQVLGVIGDIDHPATLGVPWLGALTDTERLVLEHQATGVVVSTAGVDQGRCNTIIRSLQSFGIHVLIDPGLTGIEARRLHATAVAHEPLLWVQAPRLNRAQGLVKRVFDIVVAGTAVVVLSPVFAIVAALVKAGDRGPVFFRQERVGRYGRTFGVLKFRTMHVDAEARLAELAANNERTGPLFKMRDDPRVTRAGRWLRDSSLDELPQLFNVLKGDMSLVGPRPALLSEVEQFSDHVRVRELVMPGITGLWQVEARDNPSFEAYRRLDQFYVENWTPLLDVLILLATVEHVVVRVVKSFNRQQPAATPTESPE
jgi:exopolysaccharide biosynthesis polyprenyl glycosylphosphotransferase